MPHYNYEPLDEAAQEIRILTLLPGKFSDSIRILLRRSRLTQRFRESYEALSYVWGSPEHPVDIAVGHAGQTLTVTRNLAEALPYLRYEDQPRDLWIDAICINQNDLPERGSQVRRMGEIYREALRVIAWLGTGNDDSDLAITALDKLSAGEEFHPETSDRRSTGKQKEDSHSTSTKSAPSSKKLTLILQSIFDRPWFERLWVWQEIRLANDCAIIQCGSRILLWEQFRDAVYYLATKDMNRRPPKHVMFLCLPNTMPRLENSIYFTQDCKCSDPRDRVFAMLSMLGPEDQVLNIVPDYEKSAEEVYEDVVLRMIEKQDRLDMIAACELRNRPQVKPSWVPDWSTRRVTDPLPYNERQRTPSRAKYVGNGVLQVKGKVSGNISSFEVIENSSQTSEEDIEAFRKVVPRDADKRPYVGGGTLFEAYFRTLNCNLLEYHLRRSLPFQMAEAYLSAVSIRLKSILEDDSFDPASLDTMTMSYLVMLRDTCRERSLFQTPEGIIGLGPATLQPGDEICAIFGSDQTMILRPLDDGHHLVVGECYIHGTSHLEVLLGALPAHYSYDASYQLSFRVHAARYINHDTSVAEVEHPLLGELPKGWTQVLHLDQGPRATFVNEVTGVKTEFDPRLHPEVLRERGVDVKTFQLI